MKYGLGGLNNKFNSNSNNNFKTDMSRKLAGAVVAGRVKSIVLDQSHPRFEELGGFNALGTIEFDTVSSPAGPSQRYPVAHPLFANISNYPLINEVVYILSLPDSESNEVLSSTISYYVSTVSMWSHPHCNPLPFERNLNKNKPATSTKNYSQVTAGSVNITTDQVKEVSLGNTFKERSNIHPLLNFEGDVIYEGRWGNSIRFGSTVQNRPNNWSVTGSNGDPILILRNGQGDNSPEGWTPTVEDVNKDLSSIYLTSTQQVPIKVAQAEYKSYLDSTPTLPDKYSGKQIILNSGRLVFNSNQDHILLSSNKSINISTVQGLYIDSPKGEMVVNSPNIQLGSADSFESALKGDTTVDILSDIMKQLILLIGALQSVTPTGGPGVSQVATSLLPNMQKLLSQLQTQTKSNVVKLS